MPKTKTTKTITRQYQRAKFSRFRVEDIATIAASLEQLLEKEGEVRTSRVLELAREPSHALHRFIFEDSERIAAEKWYREMARRICRAVDIAYVDDLGEVVASGPMLVSVTRDVTSGKVTIKQRSFISMEQIVANPATRKAMLNDALQDAERVMERVRHLEEFAEVVSAIRRTAERLRR